MTSPHPTPVLRDPARLREVAALGLVSPRVTAMLQADVEAAAARLGLPVALVSVVLHDAQHFAAAHGLPDWVAEAGGTPIEWSFCRHVVESGRPFVVEDAAAHALVRDNPLVELEHVRCYAGVPLVTSRGHAVGAVCVLGTSPRTFTDEELDVLRAAADRAMAAVEAHRDADA